MEGTNLAWEGMHYWKDWPAYIGTDDELGLIDYHMTGQLVFQPPGEGTHAARVKALWDEMDIPHETWDAATIKERLPYLDPGLFGPRHVPTMMRSGRTRRGNRAWLFRPRRRVCERSPALLPQPPARSRSERCRVLVRRPGRLR